MLGSRYLRILRRPGTALLLVPTLAARIPDSIASTAIVILVRSVTGSYSAAGLAAGAFGTGTALSAPLAGRAVDPLGQRRVLPVPAAAFAGAFAVLLRPLRELWRIGRLADGTVEARQAAMSNSLVRFASHAPISGRSHGGV